MTTETITPQHFAAMVALTSIRPGGKTHDALQRHLVLGMTMTQAAEMTGIAPPVLYRALSTLEHAAMRAREFVRISTPAAKVVAIPAPRAARPKRGSPS